MKSIDEILNEAATESTQTFRKAFTGTGYTRSGKSFESIQPEDNKIVGHIAVSTNIHGREPGTQPPSGYVQGTATPTELMQWCMDIFSQTAKEARGTSYVVARSLKEKGNAVYQGTKSPIPTGSTVEKAEEIVTKRVKENFTETIKGYGL